MTFEEMVIWMVIASILWWAGCAVYIAIKTNLKMTARELLTHSAMLAILIWDGYQPVYSPNWREEWKKKEKDKSNVRPFRKK